MSPLCAHHRQIEVTTVIATAVHERASPSHPHKLLIKLMIYRLMLINLKFMPRMVHFLGQCT
jgi:hypothetical protein